MQPRLQFGVYCVAALLSKQVRAFNRVRNTSSRARRILSVVVGAEADRGQGEAYCLARQYHCDGHAVRTADAAAENCAWLRARHPGLPLQIVTPEVVRTAILATQQHALTDEAIHGLARRMPELSARQVLSHGQKIVFLFLAAALLGSVCLWPLGMLQAITVLLALAFVISGLFRAALAWAGADGPADARLRPQIALPLYTILVPLYREANVLPRLAQALRALDYPADRLDIKLVLEADDAETIAAAQACGEGFDIIAVPAEGPRTKPKAANYALQFARGDYLVIFDAEDRPEPDQLLKAVAAFRAAPRQLACVQARLNFYNADRNWMTRMFALDYALWFDMLLPGLERWGVPMPLGGTSNHFRTQVLRDIGGWDAFNVTEDADIGIRLAQLGYGVSMIRSTTYEEAPGALGPWLRQRSRWLKGHMQTWLVHMRDPVGLWRRAGPGGFVAFQLFLGGGIVFALANPLLWLLLLGGLLWDWNLWRGLGPVPGVSLLLNNVLLTALAMLSPRRCGRADLAPYGLTVIAWWALVSLAGYRALGQLVTRPFHWEKTPHGDAAA